MATSDNIPVGRTSLVKKGAVSLQVQTEYASRPNPRITTCILNSGQILHKIERTLERPVVTIEEQLHVEGTIKRQHAEVLAILQGDTYTLPSTGGEITSSRPGLPPMTAEARLAAIAGVQRVIRLENDGTFADSSLSEEFKQQFSAVFRGLRDIMELFGRIPGVGTSRQRGVYEVERDRLYFASAGTECYFVLVRRVDVTTHYEQMIRTALNEAV
ncbi:MAG: hypothetical protein AB1644_03240 [Candidatus Zixiibacteriota bacterium]